MAGRTKGSSPRSGDKMTREDKGRREEETSECVHAQCGLCEVIYYLIHKGGIVTYRAFTVRYMYCLLCEYDR
jgi:hypothetical protein